MNKEQPILVTGAAGFIGYHLCEKLLQEGYTVIGLDNLNDYYSVQLKLDRLKQLGIDSVNKNEASYGALHKNSFVFYKMDIADREELPALFKKYTFQQVCHLAAQAGVRYSLENPMAYVDSNLVGFVNLLECMRHTHVKKLVYASSSSVYGNNANVPFSVQDPVDHPISLYAATKKSNELMAYSYAHLYGIQTIGLRFFTVYGPWGRPDMAMFLFTDAILHTRAIQVFNNGNLSRDFTYISDIIQGVYATIQQPSKKQTALYNIGNGTPVKLLDFIEAIEKEVGIVAKKEMQPMQPGDMEQTWAEMSALQEDYKYQPDTPIAEGVKEFVHWYVDYYKITTIRVNNAINISND